VPLLESVFNQVSLPGEVIIVDDASGDGTVDMVKKFPVKVLAQTKNGGAAKCRNIGVREAMGKVVLFLDSDTSLLPSVIASVVDGFNSDDNIHAMNGYCHYKPLNKGWAVLYKGLVENSWRDDAEDWDDTSTCINARIGAFTRESLLEIGGFDEAYRGVSVEDHELGVRYAKKYKIYLNKKMMVMHHFSNFSETVKNYWNRTYETMKLVDQHKGVLDSAGVSMKSAIQYLLGAALLSFPVALIMPLFWIVWISIVTLYIFSIRGLLKRFFANGPIFGIFCIALHAFYGVIIVAAGTYYKIGRMIKGASL
jgi:glycosyltransferase involved in cell wall biosynthesis